MIFCAIHHQSATYSTQNSVAMSTKLESAADDTANIIEAQDPRVRRLLAAIKSASDALKVAQLSGNTGSPARIAASSTLQQRNDFPKGYFHHYVSNMPNVPLAQLTMDASCIICSNTYQNGRVLLVCAITYISLLTSHRYRARE